MVGRNGTTYKYHSDCGTFNDKINQKHLSLDEDTKVVINNILVEYISLATEELPVTDWEGYLKEM